jgi:uncharacterized membrane protein YqgA involved in biofilm formation
MIGTLINTAAIIAGSAAGVALKKNFPEKYETVFFDTVGLFTLLLGVKMSLDISSPVLILLALIAGGFAGERMRLSVRVEQFGAWLKSKTGVANGRFSEGLTAGMLLFCMGSMGVIGAIEEGFGKTSDLLLVKSALDFISSFMLASALGVGVLYSAVPLLVYQGGITLLVSLMGRSVPDEIIAGITVTGGIMLTGLGINLLKIKKIEIVNLMPALVFICIFIGIKIIYPLISKELSP